MQETLCTPLKSLFIDPGFSIMCIVRGYKTKC